MPTLFDRPGLKRLDVAAKRRAAHLLKHGHAIGISGCAHLSPVVRGQTIPIAASWRAERAIPSDLAEAPDADLEREMARRIEDMAATAEAELARAVQSWARRLEQRLRQDPPELARAALELLAARLPAALHKLRFDSPNTFRNRLGGLTADLIRQARLSATAAQVRIETGLENWISLYPAARAMKRRLRLFLGPTNSGKTHTAFERLVAARSGCYLAPLRLLALEGYDRLQAAGLSAALRTGEETREDGNAAHVAATVEMADLGTAVEMALIDEIQMIADPARGWAWTAAVAGIPAAEVIMMGSADAEPMVRAIAERTGDTLEVVRFDRLSPLEIEPKPLRLQDLKPGDAVIAFSRAEVLRLRHALAGLGHTAATIYGALGPEVRKAEAERFRSGEAPILVATDAIGMGLNLPIRRVVFSCLEKFDGKQRRPLTPSEIRQIAGRAGRYGFGDGGHVSVLDGNDLSLVARALEAMPVASRDTRPWLMPPVTAILKIADVYKTDDLARIITIFRAQVMAGERDVRAPAFDSMMAIAGAIAHSGLALETQWRYASAPIDTRDPQSLEMLASWADRHAEDAAIACPQLPSIEVPDNERALLDMETAGKIFTAYLWLNQRFPAAYPEENEAWFSLAEANRLIEQAMRLKHLDRSCKCCGDSLPARHRFELCDPCFRASRSAHFRHAHDTTRRRHAAASGGLATGV